MDGLIKGLVDVALGAGGGHDHDGGEGEEQPRDVQSRFSWAEVVSGDQDQDDHERRRHSQQNPCNKHVQDCHSRLDHEWEDTGSRVSRRPQKENREENNDGWETVGRKPPRRPHRVVVFA